MKAKIVEAETVVAVEYPYSLGEQIAILYVIGRKDYTNFKHNDDMTLLYKLVGFEQREDW